MTLIVWTILFLPLLYLIWKRIMGKFDFFKELGIPYEKGVPFLGSMAKNTFTGGSFPDFLIELKDKYRNRKFFGFFDAAGPVFVLQDPDLIKQVTVKEFDHFVNHLKRLRWLVHELVHDIKCLLGKLHQLLDELQHHSINRALP